MVPCTSSCCGAQGGMHDRAQGVISCSRLCSFPSCPGPESVTQLQRAPAAAAHSEVSPDCHLPTPGSEQLQVSHLVLSLGLSALVSTGDKSTQL